MQLPWLLQPGIVITSNRVAAKTKNARRNTNFLPFCFPQRSDSNTPTTEVSYKQLVCFDFDQNQPLAGPAKPAQVPGPRSQVPDPRPPNLLNSRSLEQMLRGCSLKIPGAHCRLVSPPRRACDLHWLCRSFCSGAGSRLWQRIRPLKSLRCRTETVAVPEEGRAD